MKELKITSQFKKDLKKYQNQPKRIENLKAVKLVRLGTNSELFK